jgi:hypothetical protein
MWHKAEKGPPTWPVCSPFLIFKIIPQENPFVKCHPGLFSPWISVFVVINLPSIYISSGFGPERQQGDRRELVDMA